MDLLNTDGDDLYFLEPLPEGVEELIKESSENYACGEGELPLLRAYLIAGNHLTVLVGLYRFYYYQHRYEDALKVAEITTQISGERLGLLHHWQEVNEREFSISVSKSNSIGLARFYLLALKGVAYINLRLGKVAEGIQALKTILLLDPLDRIGARGLLEVVEESCAPQAEQAVG